MKILIADDSTFMRAILSDILTRSKWAGAEIFEAQDGVEALALFEKHQPDLVLLDIIMPNKDGLEVLKEIGSLAKAVVIVSSVGQDKTITDAKMLGAKEYIVKPFEEHKVLETLDRLWPET